MSNNYLFIAPSGGLIIRFPFREGNTFFVIFSFSSLWRMSADFLSTILFFSRHLCRFYVSKAGVIHRVIHIKQNLVSIREARQWIFHLWHWLYIFVMGYFVKQKLSRPWNCEQSGKADIQINSRQIERRIKQKKELKRYGYRTASAASGVLRGDRSG